MQTATLLQPQRGGPSTRLPGPRRRAPSPVTDSTPSPRSDPSAPEAFFLEVYAQLHRLAKAKMQRQAADHTLQPTALIHEAYLRLQRQREGGFVDRDHYLCAASQAMRQILVDHARRWGAGKRPPSERRVDLCLEDLTQGFDARAGGLGSLEVALERLEVLDPDLARLVELHFFGGQTMDDCARLLGISPRQAYRQWKTARGFLFREIQRERDGAER